MKNKTFIFFLSLLLIIGLFPISALSKSDYIKLEAPPTNLKVDLMEDSEGYPTLDLPWMFLKV